MFGGTWCTPEVEKVNERRKNKCSMYQLGGCGKTFVEGFGLPALEVVGWLLWKTAMAYHGTVDKRYSWNIGEPNR